MKPVLVWLKFIFLYVQTQLVNAIISTYTYVCIISELACQNT